MRYRESQDLLPIPHQLLSRLPMDPLLPSMPMVEPAASGCGGGSLTAGQDGHDDVAGLWCTPQTCVALLGHPWRYWACRGVILIQTPRPKALQHKA